MYRIGSHECAAPYAGVLSAWKDMLFTHVGSVIDGGERKKRDLGRIEPHPATCWLCNMTHRPHFAAARSRTKRSLSFRSAQLNMVTCPLGRSEPGSKCKRLCA